MKDLNNKREPLKQQGIAIIQYDDGPLSSYPYDTPWLTDPEFSALYNVIRSHTLVDRNRCYALYLLTQQCNKLPGDILEVGSWRGGTAGLFTSLAPRKKVYLADTFTGVVKASAWEHYKDKAHSDTSESIVRELLDKKLKVSNHHILKGIFPEETGQRLSTKHLSLVYLDVDVYQSTKDSFEYIWDRVVPGGVVAFDDYGFISACGGIKKFIDEIKDDTDKLFLQNLNGQAYIVKV